MLYGILKYSGGSWCCCGTRCLNSSFSSFSRSFCHLSGSFCCCYFAAVCCLLVCFDWCMLVFWAHLHEPVKFSSSSLPLHHGNHCICVFSFTGIWSFRYSTWYGRVLSSWILSLIDIDSGRSRGSRAWATGFVEIPIMASSSVSSGEFL